MGVHLKSKNHIKRFQSQFVGSLLYWLFLDASRPPTVYDFFDTLHS